MSGKFGFLYPVLLMDCLPGDTVRDTMTAFCRFAPMLAPVMHRIDVTTHFFFVPNRILSDHWEDFITGGREGTSAPVLPFIKVSDVTTDSYMRKGNLWDYLGLPVWNGTDPTTSVEQISVLPFRAYQKIWNDYYRDPNFEAEADLDLEVQGNVTGAEHVLWIRNRGWQKDYFTAALPFAQRGAEVLLPLGGSGSVTYTPVSQVLNADGTAPLASGNLTVGIGDPDLILPTAQWGRIENIDEVTLDTSNITINDFRMSLALQRWMENNARGGGRYIEQIQSHFNQRVPDYRLQRAEYLGGGRQPVTISEVLSTADSEDVPVGDLAGHGLSVGKSNRFTYKCQEHGFVIGIMSVMPTTAYFQGIDRMWSRVTRYDYAWPELAHLGEQEILSKEVYYGYASTDDDENAEVFGYIPRYAEYKFKQDRVAGDYRDTLAFWHLARIFLVRPALDAQFTTMYENGDDEETFRRIFAVQSGADYLWFQLFHRLTAKRPLPYFGVPQI